MSDHHTVKGFEAWLDKMPGKNNAIIVVGHVQVPTGGWTGTLTPAVPQGINPAILILNAELKEPGGFATDVISQVELRYSKEHGEAYKTVTITGLGDDFNVPVGEVH